MVDRFGGPPAEDADALGPLDPDALREFNTLAEFLAGLSQHQAERDESSMSSVVATGTELEQSPRWLIGLRGVRRLARLASLREHLTRAPSCLAARVVDLSPAEIHLMVTTTARISRAELDAMLTEAMVAADCPAAFDVVSQPATGSG